MGMKGPLVGSTALLVLFAASAGAQEEVATDRKEAKAPKSVEDVYQEQHALFGRRFVLETGVTYTHSERNRLVLNGFLALNTIFLGEIAVDSVKSDILTFDITGRYGVSDRLQLDLNAPFVARRTEYRATGLDGDATTASTATVDDSNVGDVSAGLNYRLLDEQPGRPDVVLNMRLKGPTGEHPYGVETVTDPNNSNLEFPKELPTGNGVWALTTGLSFIKTVDPAILFANIGYTYNKPEDFDDISSDDGDQPGEVDLGDSVQFGLGTAFALNREMSISLSYSQRVSDDTETKLDGGSWSEVPGSDANAATMNFGVTYALGERTSLLTNIGAGLTDDASDMTVSVKVPYTF